MTNRAGDGILKIYYEFFTKYNFRKDRMMNKRFRLTLSFLFVICLMTTTFSFCVQAYTQGKDGMGPVVISGGQRDFKWPVPGYYNIQSCFYDTRNHCAIDISAPQSTPVVASYDGKVIKSVDGGTSYKGDGFGNYVVLEHNYATLSGNITLYTRYSHLNSASVSVGATVSAGQEIGKVGTTGNSTGYHLDFQILYGNWQPYQTYSIDPYSNQLLELPSNVVVYDSWDCGQSYYKLVKELYSQELNIYTAKCTFYPSCGTATVSKECTVKSIPCTDTVDASSKELYSLSKGTTVQVDGMYKNTKDNYWYRIKYNGDTCYLYAGNASFSSTATVSISGVSAPQTIQVGKVFSIKGKITSDIPLRSISAIIYLENGDGVMSHTVDLSSSNQKTYELYNSEIDAKLTFNTLSKGGYLYRVYASAYNNYSDGEQLFTETIGGIMHQSNFSVVSSTSCSHTYKSTTTAAGCETSGKITYTCTKCGYSYSQSIAAIGHSYSDWYVYNNATCTQNGSYRRYCYNCGVDEYDTIAPTGHSYCDWYVYNNATCTQNGCYRRYCHTCGADEYSTIPVLGHSYGDWIIDVQPSLTEGSKHRNCTRCSFVEYASIPSWKELDDNNQSSTGLSFTLDSVTMTASVYSFDNSVSTVIIPSVVIKNGMKYTVTSIGGSAFIHCSKLTSITIPESITSIDNSAFANCFNLTEIYFNAVNMSDLQMYNQVFSYVGYNDESDGITVVIGKDVKHIPAYLFCPADASYAPYINRLIFEEGSTCESIGEYAFADCGYIEYIYFSAVNMADLSSNNHVFSKIGRWSDELTVVIGKNVKYIPANLFCPDSGDSTYSPRITSLIFENGGACEKIGDYAFYQCKSLASIDMSGVVSIGHSAFFSCDALTSIVIPGSVTSIGFAAFFSCDALTNVTIGNRVTTIGEYAFASCRCITNLSIGNGVTSIGVYAFNGCSSLEKLTVDKNNTVYHSAGDCIINTKIKSLVLGCKNSVIPSDGSVTSIGSSAFYNCTSLTSITIPDSVTSIGDEAFYNCTSLTYNTYDNGCYIGNSRNPYLVLVKASSTNITSCDINENTKFIHSSAFRNCTSLTSISIPDSVTSIGDCAFYNCTSLTSVYYCGTDEEWSNISIGSYNTYLTCATHYYHKFVFVHADPTCTEIGFDRTKCEFCGLVTEEEVVSSLGHRVIITENEDVVNTENDSAYPFAFSAGIYTSTNKADLSISTFKITAVYNFTLKLEYSVSSESGYDKLIISKNGTALYTKSGIVSWTAVDISLKSGDVLTISYSKDGSVSRNDDLATFKFLNIGTYDKSAEEIEPTCTESVVCSYCHIVVKPALSEHAFGAWSTTINPTCTTDGLETRTCSICGATESIRLFASHSYGDWHVDNEPSCTSEGSKVRVCGICSSSETESITPLGHDEISHIAKAPTCTEVGWDAYVTCSRCSYTTYNEIPTQGHSWGEWSIIVAPTATQDGFRSRECDTCSNTEYGRAILGDIDGDGVLTNGDITMAVRIASGWNIHVDMVLADITGDGKVTNRDIIALIRKLAE